MVGIKRGKCIGYSVKCKSCKTCKAAIRRGINARDHDCRKNRTGTLKAMEPSMIVDMLREAKANNVEVGTVVGDNDTTTIVRVRSQVNIEIKKLGDKK